MKLEIKAFFVFTAAMLFGAFFGCTSPSKPKPPVPNPVPIACEDPAKPFPHWGKRGDQCLPSCGVLGGKSVQGNDCGGLREELSYDVSHCCFDGPKPTTTTTTLAPQVPKRTGLVRASGRALRDDQGEFVALGYTHMWALWAYQNDRAKLERNLKFMKENGFDYIRALGVITKKRITDPSQYWYNHQMYMEHPNYDADIAGLTDLVYDKYGMRVEWTIFGGFSDFTESDKQVLIDKFIRMSKGREQKIIHFEIANELDHGPGFGKESANKYLKYLQDRTDVLVAGSSPYGDDLCAELKKIHAGGAGDMYTWHFDRQSRLGDGYWRPTRQPWEAPYCEGLPKIGSNNEPIGPNSSVAEDKDPMRLLMGALNTYVSGLPFYVYHTEAGVRGNEEFINNYIPSTQSYKNMRSYLPMNLPNWTRENHHWAGHPFEVLGEIGYPPEHGSGAVRAYGAHAGVEFIVFPIGVRDYLDMKAKRKMMVQVYHPITGSLIEGKILNAGEILHLQGLSAYVVKGRWL